MTIHIFKETAHTGYICKLLQEICHKNSHFFDIKIESISQNRRSFKQKNQFVKVLSANCSLWTLCQYEVKRGLLLILSSKSFCSLLIKYTTFCKCKHLLFKLLIFEMCWKHPDKKILLYMSVIKFFLDYSMFYKRYSIVFTS